jgi:hypothetical protein
MRLLMLIGLLVLLSGCQTDPVLLQHPQTGKKVQCGPYSDTGNEASIGAATVRERGCIEDYQRQGYERVME